MYNLAYLTDVGLLRNHNEDSILINDKLHLYIVADGMGGHEKGEVASSIVVKVFLEINNLIIEKNDEDEDATIVPMLSLDAQLNKCVKKATAEIYKYARDKDIEGTIGTTVVGVKYIEHIRAWVLFHLGDSRAYLYSQGTLKQLTQDHSKHEEMKNRNATDLEIEKAGKNVITKAIGNFNTFDLDIKYITPKTKDIILLCSDGVSDLCTDEELLRLVIQYKNNLDLLCLQIKNLIYTRGAKDNLSIIVIEIR